MSLKLKITSIVAACILVLSALTSIIAVVVLNEINKGKALTNDSTYSIGNLLGENNSLNTDTYEALLSLLGNNTTSTRKKSQINDGNPIIFQMGEVNGNPIYWEVVYQTGDVITIWMTQNYTTTPFGSGNVTNASGTNYGAFCNDYSVSILREKTQSIYSSLCSQIGFLPQIVVSPSQLDEMGGKWQASQPASRLTSSDYATTQGLKTNTYSGTSKNNANYFNWIWDSSVYNDMFWIPSYYEVYNTSNTSYSFNGGYWGLTTADLSHNDVILDGNTDGNSASWLRSASTFTNSTYGYNSMYCPIVRENGGIDTGLVMNHPLHAKGVRPACHISISALQNVMSSYTVIMESCGYPSELAGMIGGFENVGWNGTFDTKHVRSGDYALKIEADSSVPEVTILASSPIALTNSNKNHIFYIQYWGYQESQTSGTTNVYWPIEEPSFGGVGIGPAGQWNMYSFYGSRSSNNVSDYAQFRIDYDNNNQNGTMWFDDIVLLDLTEIFGSGNEPTKDWCDRNIVSGTSIQVLSTDSNEVLDKRPGSSAQDYSFAGWSITPKANSSTVQTVICSDEGEVNNLTSGGGIITLYGVWANSVHITVESSNSNFGYVSGEGDYVYGEDCTLEAIPNDGYEFVGWSTNGGNTIISTDNPFKITATQDATYTAVFRLKSYAITTSTDGNGSITSSNTVTHGGSFEVTATPNANYLFDYFILNNDTSNPIRSNPYTITNITANTTITAYFKLDTRTITLETNNNTYGTVSGGGAHTLNSDVIITATANAGYSFVGWSLDGGKTLLQDSLGQANYTITVTQDATYTAVFESGITITSANPGTEFTMLRETNNGIRHRYTIQTNSGYYIERIALITNSTTPTEEDYQDILSTDGYFNTGSYCMGLHYITNTTGTELVLEVYYSTTPFTIYLDFTTEPQNYKSSGSVDGVAVSVAYQSADGSINTDETTISAIGEARIKGYTTIDGVEYVTVEAVAYTGYTFVGWQVDGEFISYTDDTTGTITLTGSAYRTADIPLSLIDGEQVVAIFE